MPGPNAADLRFLSRRMRSYGTRVSPATSESPQTVNSGPGDRAFSNFSLRTIAGMAAVFLGAIYAYGAVIKAGELHGAGLGVGNTLPLVPLEQILVLGIDQLLPIAAAVLGVVLVSMAFLDRPSNDGGGTADPGDAPNRRLVVGLRICTGAVWVFLLFAAAWTTWFLIAEITAVTWYARAEHSTRRSYAVFATAAVILFFAATAYFNPAPPPSVRLEESDGSIIQGDLIATTGSTWYVGEGDNRWTAVQSDDVEHSRVTGSSRKQQESVYHAVTGHRLFNLGPG